MLASRYSRAKEIVARQEIEVARQECRLTHHTQQMQLARADWVVAKVNFADEERRFLSLAKTIDLHEASIETEEVPAIGPKSRRLTLKVAGIDRLNPRSEAAIACGYLFSFSSKADFPSPIRRAMKACSCNDWRHAAITCSTTSPKRSQAP